MSQRLTRASSVMGLEQLWKGKYALLREFAEHMSPLYQVIRANSSAVPSKGGVAYILAVPLDSCLDAAASGGRVSQLVVRAHVLIYHCDTKRIDTMLGQPCSISVAGGLESLFSASSFVSHLDTPIADVRVMHSDSMVSKANVLSTGRVPHADGHHVMQFIFIDGRLDVPSCDPRAASFTSPARMSRPDSEMENDNGGEVSERRYRLVHTPSKRWTLNAATSATYIRAVEDAWTLRQSLFSLPGPVPLDAVNRIVTDVDVEITMFCRSYSCVKGYEHFTVARVNQIVETPIEQYFAAMASESADESVGVSSTSLESLDVDDRERIVITFHSIVTAATAQMLIEHWRVVNEVEDFAFFHACRSLQSHLTLTSCFPVGCGVEPEALQAVHLSSFDCVVALLRQLEEKKFSVLTTMRVMEAAVGCIINISAQIVSEVTADVCIPLAVFAVVQLRPQHFVSLFRYLSSFHLPVLEMSSLGYAVTTIEAANTQLLHEYAEYVTNR